MTLTKQQVREVLDVYIRAWEDQDPALIVTIFTEGATYHERVMGEPIRGRDGIRDYWQTKVVGGQANITCELLNLYLDDGTAIAEWEAEFDDRAQQVRKRMREVALLTFDGPLISQPARVLGLRGAAGGCPHPPAAQPQRPVSEL
jgi:ketosteroid isomerase-like protein